jgi:hypothetical protein
MAEPHPFLSTVARQEARRAVTEHEHRHHLDPPSPLPSYLHPNPQRAPLGPDDLRIAPSTEELQVIARLLEREHVAGQALVTMRDGSPWLEIDVAVPSHGEGRRQVSPQAMPLAPPGVYRYAIWRYTARAYRVGADGAVGDDPIELGD